MACVLTPPPPLLALKADESLYERSLEVYEKYTDSWEAELGRHQEQEGKAEGEGEGEGEGKWQE